MTVKELKRYLENLLIEDSFRENMRVVRAPHGEEIDFTEIGLQRDKHGLIVLSL